MSASDLPSPDSRTARAAAQQRARGIREQTRQRVLSELERERIERRARGERLVAGLWVPERLAASLQRARARRQRVAFFELLLLTLVALLALALWWRLFGFLFLPHVIRFIE